MENTEIKIVLGSAFGDEGKGVTVQYLCKKAIDEGKHPLVIRFSGGPQAAHTVNYNGIEHICSTYGSGVLLGVPTLIWNTAYFDPISAKNEYEILKTKMKDVPPLYIMPSTKFITPYDVNYGRNDLKILKDGTCGKGIFPTFKRGKEDFNIYYNNINEETLRQLELYYYDDDEPIEETLSEEGKLFKKFITDYNNNQYNFFNVTSGGVLLSMFDVLIFEGSQGLLLDMERGFFPNVTPSKTGLNAFTEDRFLENCLYNAEVYLVTRTYLTRHGNGYTPCKYGFAFDLEGKHETNINNEYQGEFKTGCLDFDLLNEAYTRHCLDNYWRQYNLIFNIVVTHWDLIKNEFTYIFNNKRETLLRKDYDILLDKKYPGEFERKISELFRFFPKGLRIKKLYINDSIESNLKEVKL